MKLERETRLWTRRFTRWSTYAALFVCVLLTNVTGQVARAFVTFGYAWTSGNFSYRINAASYATVFGGSAADHENWISQALSTWRERTGANLTFSYGGTTTSACINDNSINEVAAQTACFEPGCFTWAKTIGTFFAGGSGEEMDICVYGDSSPGGWSRAAVPGVNQKDLVGTVTHEFGHALGLDHTADTVMDGPTFTNGNVLARYQWGDDIAGIRSLYGVRQQTRYFRERTAAAWGSEVALGGTTHRHVNVAVGVANIGTQLVMGSLDPTGLAVHFSRANFPLGSVPSFTNRAFATTSWQPPAVAARTVATGAGVRWVGAFINSPVNTLSCGGIRVLSSVDVFDTATIVDLPADCTIHSPSLGYSSFWGRFVLAYVNLAWGANQALNNHVMVRTSTDGITWTPAQDTTIVSPEGADIKCINSSCILVSPAPDDGAAVQNRRLDLNSAGVASVSATWTNFNYSPRTAVGGATSTSSFSADWFLAAQLVPSIAQRSNGEAGVYALVDNSNPVDAFAWSFVNNAFHRPSLTAFGGTTIDLFYVR